MIELKNVFKSYGDRTIISDFNMKIDQGEFVSVTGASGSGKSTLLNLIGLVDKPDVGDIIINNIKNPNIVDKMLLRRQTFGYIFQNYLLLENETVHDNLMISKKFNKSFSNQSVIDNLNLVGFDEDILKMKVFNLSGGEKQRIAICRMMLKPYEVILADEPTGNLDKDNRDKVIDIFKHLQKTGKTIVCVTHDENMALSSDRIIKLK